MMNLKRCLLGAFGALLLTATAQTNALADPPAAAASAQHGAGGARASIRLDIGHAKAWVGQALPITLRAYFRGVEGVTLEGAPQIASREIITSELGQEPKQAAAIIGGERTLVVTWTGTVTPSGAGPVELEVDLPVRLRYREAAPRVVVRDAWQDDPFAGMDADPFGGAMFAQMRQMMEQQMSHRLGRLREQAVPLKATAHLDAEALPVTDQPASFSGAVGRFTLSTSASATHLRASEPLTLRIEVAGDGDLDRVDLPGVATSESWKAYPPKLTSAAPPAGSKKRGPRVFEQVLVPLEGGDLTVPPVSLTAFDPVSARYVTQETRPIAVSVDGAGAPDPVPPAPAVATPASAALPIAEEPPSVEVTPVKPWGVGLRVAPVLLLAAATTLLGVLKHFQKERSLRRAMRKAAAENAAGWFFASARDLIEIRLARVWEVPPEAVTALAIRERLGARGDPLADVLAADQSLRFGRAAFERAELVTLCSSVEHSLRGAS